MLLTMPLRGADVDARVTVAGKLAVGDLHVFVAGAVVRPDAQAVEAEPLRGNIVDADMAEVGAARGLGLIVEKIDAVLARGVAEAAADEVEVRQFDAARVERQEGFAVEGRHDAGARRGSRGAVRANLHRRHQLALGVEPAVVGVEIHAAGELVAGAEVGVVAGLEPELIELVD
jgi:hypothetical protein